MANGTDSAEKFVVLSNIRVGLKREFEFALKVQSEIRGSLGRTRSRKAQSNVESGCAVLFSPEVNKLKTYESRKKKKREEQSVVKEMEVESEEEVKSDVADVNNEVENDNEDKNGSEKMGVEEKRVLVNVEGVTVENEQRVVEEKWVLMNVEEVTVENEQRVEESNEIEKEAVLVEEEKKNGRDEVSMNLEESNCEEVDHGKSGNDLMGEENNEFEEIVVGVEYEKKNGYDNVSMNVEEDKQNEFDREKGEYDLKGEVKNAFEAVVGVEEDENNESDRVAMDVEEVKCEEADQGPEMAVTEVAEEKKNDIQRVLVENGVLERPFEGKDSSIFAKGGSSVTEPVVTAGNDDGKAVNGVVERPFRRFTRSLLQQKVELEKESSSKEIKCEEVVQGKECGPEKFVMEVDEEKKNDTERELVDYGVLERPFEGKYSSISYKGRSSVIEPVVTASDDNGKAVNGVVERPLRRFTRSFLQQKVELEKESPSKVGGIETDVTEIANGGVGAPVKLERVMKSKKVMRKFYTRLKDFLESGILEGMPVRYHRGSRVKGSGVRGLQGVVKGSGISCFCRDCKGNLVVTPTVFELHAGSSNKHPPEFIYLENGNTLRDIMNACKDSPLEILEEAVRMVVGSSSIKKSSFCLNCRGSITNAGVEELVLLCKSCAELKESHAHSTEMEPQAPSAEMKGPQPPAVLGVSQAPSTELTDTSDGSPEPSSVQKSSHSKMKSSSLKSHGKITRKDLRMHKLVFEEGGLQDGTEVGYFVRGKKYLVGYKKGFGILCSCCNSEVSPSQFESHAGWATRRKPFQHIYTSNGVSLHELSIKLSLERSFSTKENDDLCGICMDGGDLLCCDSCPRAFHIDCCSLPVVPSGTWYCRYCTNMFQREKFVEHNANARAAGRILGVDPIAQITSRCIRIVQTPDTELGGCVLCRGRDFCKSRFGRRTVILCDQCEREYHVGCLKDHGMEDLQELPKGKWLCCADCKRINSALQKLVDRGEEKLPETSLDGIKNKHQQSGSNDAVHVDVRWRVLRGKKADASDGTRVLLSKAVSIFHDRFDPIIESASRLDLIPAMAYGRTHKGQDYHGMYCAILTVNQVVVSAGIFRIFGQELAELPLVATSNDCQGQGYFQSLFSCIEKLLSFLNVKKLVLPSASEAQAIWTNKFGFNMMTDEEQNKHRNDYPLMIFQGTAMLQKPVPKCRIIGKPVNE